MSLEAMIWALKVAPVDNPIEHLVLIGLSDHAAPDGTGAYPSAATLADYARCGVRSVRTRLNSLEAAGLIRRGDQNLVAHFRADRRPVVWDVMVGVTERLGVHEMHAEDGVHDVHGVHVGDARGARSGIHGVHAGAHKPSSNQPVTVPSSASPTAMVIAPAATILDEAFDAFWAAYPRKVEKKKARKAFAKAVEYVGGRADIIVDGARRMAADPNLPEQVFIPHATTWLNRGRWEDAPYPARATSGPVTTASRVSDALAVARRMAEAEGHPAPLAIGSGL